MDLRSSNDLLAAAAQVEDEGDDFDKLKAAREKEKLMRQQKNLARTISTAPGMEATAVPMVPMIPVNVAVPQAQMPTVASSADLLVRTSPTSSRPAPVRLVSREELWDRLRRRENQLEV